MLEPFLFYITALVNGDTSDWFGKNYFNIYVIYQEETELWRYKISKSDAEDYLKNLVKDFCDKTQFDMIPFDLAAEKTEVKPYKQDSYISSDEIRKKYREELEEEVPDRDELSDLLLLAEAKIPDDVYEKVKRRFTLFFKTEKLKPKFCKR